MRNPDPQVQATVAEMLRAIGPQAQAAVPVLIEALAAADPAVQRGAMEALKSVTGQDFGMDVEQWQQWWAAQQQ
jgi:HEAT repeat protein